VTFIVGGHGGQVGRDRTLSTGGALISRSFVGILIKGIFLIAIISYDA
jgi:hypothetical protein